MSCAQLAIRNEPNRETIVYGLNGSIQFGGLPIWFGLDLYWLKRFDGLGLTLDNFL